MCESPKEKAVRYEWMGKFVQNILKYGDNVSYPSGFRHLEPKRPKEFKGWWHRHFFLYLIKECGFDKVSGHPRKSKALSRDGAPELYFYIKPYMSRNDKESTREELIRAFLNSSDDDQQCMAI